MLTSSPQYCDGRRPETDKGIKQNAGKGSMSLLVQNMFIHQRLFDRQSLISVKGVVKDFYVRMFMLYLFFKGYLTGIH